MRAQTWVTSFSSCVRYASLKFVGPAFGNEGGASPIDVRRI